MFSLCFFFNFVGWATPYQPNTVPSINVYTESDAECWAGESSPTYIAEPQQTYALFKRRVLGW